MQENNTDNETGAATDKRSTETSSGRGIGLWLLPLLILAGVVIGWLQPFSLAELLAWGRGTADAPLYIALVVVGMAVLMTFGLPGSLCLWLIAPFQPPWLATLLLLAGSVAGAFGAYLVGRRLSDGWQPQGVGAKVVKLLQRQSDMFTQMALRILPGFPHSVINYAGGVLMLPLLAFLLSALIGLAVKWAVYATAVHGVVDAVETGEAVQASTLVPLLVLSILLLCGAWVKSRVARD